MLYKVAVFKTAGNKGKSILLTGDKVGDSPVLDIVKQGGSIFRKIIFFPPLGQGDYIPFGIVPRVGGKGSVYPFLNGSIMIFYIEIDYILGIALYPLSYSLSADTAGQKARTTAKQRYNAENLLFIIAGSAE